MARAQGPAPPGQGVRAKGSTTGSPAMQKKKKIVAALSVWRTARMALALVAAKTAAARAAACPRPKPKPRWPWLSTMATPMEAARMASHRWRVGRSRNTTSDMATAITGNTL